MYYPDAARIEDALIPALLRCLLYMHLDHNSSLKDDLVPKIIILEQEMLRAFKGLTHEKARQLGVRLERICKVVEVYLKKEKFDTRKCLLTLTAWAQSLKEGGVFRPGEDFKSLLETFDDVISQGYKEIDNFKKIDLSAINHVQTIHKLVQNEGYF